MWEMRLLSITPTWVGGGEGDEKVYVDGETFPSHFGTGTEDYYGYAWGRYEPWINHPFCCPTHRRWLLCSHRFGAEYPCS